MCEDMRLVMSAAHACDSNQESLHHLPINAQTAQAEADTNAEDINKTKYIIDVTIKTIIITIYKSKICKNHFTPSYDPGLLFITQHSRACLSLLPVRREHQITLRMRSNSSQNNTESRTRHSYTKPWVDTLPLLTPVPSPPGNSARCI
jgi:hypothetical protein